MDLRTKALKGVAWSVVRKWGSRLINLVVFTILARLLATEAFGLVALGGTYVAFIRVFVDQGFADALIQRDELTEAHPDTAFWVNLALSVVFVVVSVGTAPWIGWIFEEPDLGPVVMGLSPSFVLIALAGVQEALFERDLDYRTLAVREFVAALFGGGVGVTMAYTGYGVWSLVGLMLGERTAAVVVLWTASSWWPGFKVGLKPFKDLFSFGVNVLGTNLLGYVNRRADNLIIGYVLGAELLGFYEVAYRLFQAGTGLITNAVSSVAFSTFSRLQDEPARMREGFYTATQMVCLVAFPVFFGAALVAPELIGTFFGDKWLPLSAQTFQVLSFVGVMHAAFYFNSSVMFAMGKPDWQFYLGLLNAGANVLAFTVAVRWGIVAVALAFAFRNLLVAPLPLHLVRRLIGIEWREYLSAYGIPMLGTGIMTGVVFALRWGMSGASDVVLLASAIPLGGAAYVGTLALVVPKRLSRFRGLLAEVIFP